MSNFKAKMHQIQFRLGLTPPRPYWGSLQRSPGPLAGFSGLLFLRGREGKGGSEGRGWVSPLLFFCGYAHGYVIVQPFYSSDKPRPFLPNVVRFAVDFAVPYEASARFIKQLLTVSTSQTVCVPLHVWSDPQNVLVKYRFTASDTRKVLPLILHRSLAIHKQRVCDIAVAVVTREIKLFQNYFSLRS